MIDEATYDELDRYFHSNMNADEKSAFESRVNSNAQLKEELLWLNTMLGSMKQQGRSVMKQTIANAISGVPSGEMAKYKPSVNGKSFLKKWWWAISSVIVASALAVAIYSYTAQDSHSEERDESHSVLPQEAIAPVDSSSIDSVKESMQHPSDSVKAAITKETAYVHFEDDVILVKTPKAGNSPGVTRLDSMKRAYVVDASLTETNGTQREKNKPMFVIPGYKPQPPYTYTLEVDLTLNAPWRSTKGFKFEELGDTVYMTDTQGVKYMLLRNRGVQMLEPMKGAGK